MIRLVPFRSLKNDNGDYMKIQVATVSLALLSTLATTTAHAESVASLAASSSRLIAAAQKDVRFLNSNVDNCTSYGTTIKQRMIAPVMQDLIGYQEALESNFGNLAPAGGRACNKPRVEELSRAEATVNKIIVSIGSKLAATKAPQSELMGMTGDEAVTKALSADSSHPNCRPDREDDPSSTRELKTYFALKQKMAVIKAAMTALKAETHALVQNQGQSVCKKD
jgi:hypothetical protein